MKRHALLNGTSIPLIGQARAKPDVVAVLKDALDQAKSGKISNVAMIVIDAPGQFRVVGAGSDVDGMHAGCIELFKQLDKLVNAADAQAGKPLLDA